MSATDSGRDIAEEITVASLHGAGVIGWPEVVRAWNSIATRITPLYHSDFVTAAVEDTRCRIVLAHEHNQHTGTFRARGALYFLHVHRISPALQSAGVAIATTEPATARAWAWAARIAGVRAALFVSPTVGASTIAAVNSEGASVHVLPGDELQSQCAAYVARTGAVVPDPADSYVVAGAGTWVRDNHCLVPDIDTVVIPGTDRSLVLGTIATATDYGCRTVVVTPADATPAADVIAGWGPDDPDESMRPKCFRPSHEGIVAAQRILRRRGIWVGTEGACGVAALTAQSLVPDGRYRPDHAETVAVLLSTADLHTGFVDGRPDRPGEDFASGVDVGEGQR